MSRTGHTVDKHQFAAADFAGHIRLDLAATSLEFSAENNDESRRSDLADTATVKVDIAEARPVGLTQNRPLARLHGVAGTVLVEARTAVTVMVIPPLPIGEGGGGEECGRRQRGSRNPECHDVFHHVCEAAPTQENGG